MYQYRILLLIDKGMRVTEVEFVRGAVTSTDFPQDGRVEVAFIGRSNVGKSSMINSLLGHKVARTSNTPGRTQQINFFLVNESFYFVDLPGYGYANVSKVKQGQLQRLIEKYLAERKTSVLTIMLVDSRHLPSKLDLQTKSWLEQSARPFLVVLTKSDKLSNNELNNQMRGIKAVLGTDRVIPYSSVTGLGRDALWKSILSQINS